MTAVIYTYPPDYHLAGLSARIMAERGLNVVLAIDAADPPLACEFAATVRTDFDRRGNLNGKDFILGHLRLMLEHASGSYAFKVDSDTLLLDPVKLLDGRDETAVGVYVTGMGGMQGCCYALKVADLPAMIEAAEGLHPRRHLLEDKTIGELAMQVGRVHLPVWARDACGYALWDPARPREVYQEKAVLCYNVNESSSRRAIATSMKKFLQ